MRKLLLFLLLVGTAAGGIAGWYYYPRSYSLSESKLKFTHLQFGDLRDTVSATGRVKPCEIIEVSCEMPGLVTEVQGDVNRAISPGDELARLDDHKLQLEYQEASNGLSAAQAALAQAQALKKAAKLAVAYQTDINAKGGFRSELEQAAVKLEAAEAGVSVAQSQVQVSKTALEKAEEALAKTVIKLPANCGQVSITAPATCRKFYVLERHVQLGQFVTPGAPLFLVTAEPRNMEVHAEVAEADIAKVRVGLPATFSVPSYSDEDVFFKGAVREIRPQGVNSKGAVYYVAVVEVANKKDPASGEWLLRPGMTASIDVIRRKHEKVWSMPVSALNFQMDDAYLNEATRGRIAQWNERPDARQWRTIWTWDAAPRTPQPVFVRLEGVNKNGEPGLKDGEFSEILEWEPGRQPQAGEGLRIIIDAPPARSRGFFDQPMNIKVS